MAQYGKTTYWDERYTKDPEPFDWYQRYSGIKDLLAQYARQRTSGHYSVSASFAVASGSMLTVLLYPFVLPR